MSKKINFSGFTAFLRGLPRTAKGIVSALTVAATALGVASVVAPAGGAHAVAAVAAATGIVSGLLHFMSNPSVENVITDISKK